MFNVRGQKLDSHFDEQQFDVIIINAPRAQPPAASKMSATQFNKKLLINILIEAKNYLTPNGRIDVQLGPRHPASRLKILKKSRQVKFMANEYEYGVSYTPRSNTYPHCGAKWKTVFESLEQFWLRKVERYLTW